ncbi:hypothetical protein [Thalassotalea agarivorans]|uniref:EF-hand domain-containing protein n=1 Tax=Thalassotalea agarivorans TaxID=349064 RepID=A0A1I0EM36_THASX|nr:hypothetical protein [Thalassotalea agarivorans]SET46304.1 hypothetical protein SAMN05660429_01850 [Thalassotalea agarivorans]
MEYWKGPSESLLGIGTIWTEFDENGYAVRQVEKYGNKWFSSREEYHDDVGPGLYDGHIKELDLSDSNTITKQEFETVWQESLK